MWGEKESDTYSGRKIYLWRREKRGRRKLYRGENMVNEPDERQKKKKKGKIEWRKECVENMDNENGKKNWRKMHLLKGVTRLREEKIVWKRDCEKWGLYLGETTKIKPHDAGLHYYNLGVRFGSQIDIAMFTLDFNYTIGVTNAYRDVIRTNSNEIQLSIGLVFWSEFIFTFRSSRV